MTCTTSADSPSVTKPSVTTPPAFMMSRTATGPVRFALLRLMLSGCLAVAAWQDTAASAADASEDAAAVAFFESKVRPLLHRRCGECHSTEHGPENGELILDSSQGLRSGGSRGPAVIPGKPEGSLLLEAVRYKNPDLQMPPDGRLPESEILILQNWIRNGAVFPEYGRKMARPARTAIDIARGRQFWAFQPLSDDPLPDIDHPDAAVNPIDVHILERLEQSLSAQGRDLRAAGNSLLPPAPRRTLIRRLHFDLIGLPPEPEAVDAFLADDSPDAVTRLIDRLLASPQYGERWARVWLDLARYTDTTASWLKGTGKAWLYRDWVVRALNEDLPYDRFVRLQLAADLMENVPPRDYAALGFLGLSPTYWKELRLAPDVIRTVVAEEWDERIDAVSRTFLGLTIACARCHDHKFDPISQEDYYGLAGVFASTQLQDRPLLPEPAASTVRAAHARVEQLEARIRSLKDADSDEVAALQREASQIRRDTPDFHAPWAHVVHDAAIYVHPNGDDATRIEYREGEFRNVSVFRRGNPANRGAEISRRFPVVLASPETSPFSQGSGRLELADSLLNDAETLTARVIVNRIWAQYFDQGLVRTLSNFGEQGERPSHPELLDRLAAGLIQHGWSLKWLHRTIVQSATYQQASRVDPEWNNTDPENRLLWTMPTRRLPVEMWRDAMLAASGSLDTRIGGPPMKVDSANHHRRTLYSLIARRELHPMLRLYDFPEPTAHSPRREPTTTPLQQLFVLNGPLVQRESGILANRLLATEATTSQRIDMAWRRLFGRPPDPVELELGQEFLAAGPAATNDPEPAAELWARYVHVLIGLNEFLFVD